jgi:hypothetical protein
MNEALPTAHPLPFVDAIRPYITAAVLALTGSGIPVLRSWLDPYDPRDATILFAQDIRGTGGSGRSPAALYALVWDEETGWRYGAFVSGEPGVRTVLARATALGGGLLPSGDELVARILSGVAAQPLLLRRWFDTADGFEDALRRAGRTQSVAPR